MIILGLNVAASVNWGVFSKGLGLLFRGFGVDIRQV